MSTRNRTTIALTLAALAAIVVLSPVSQVQAAPIFTEDFNGYSGTQNNTQYETGLNVAHSGTVANWSTSGAGTMHAVDLGSSNWAIMFYQDNVITLATGIAANDSGTPYVVEFDYGTAVYHDGGAYQRTLTGDGLLVEVVRGDNTVLASQSFLPGAWDDAGNHNLDAGLTGTLSYAGDGTGVVRLRIGPDGSLNSGRFEGEIDNISVDVVPEPATMSLLAIGGLGVLLKRRRLRA